LTTIDRRSSGFIRLAAASAILFAAFLILQQLTYRLVGADIYTEHAWPETFARIFSHKEMYEISGATGVFAAGFSLPILLGFAFTVDEDDRPYVILAGMFLIVSTCVATAAFGQYGNLVGDSFDYMNHLAPPDVIIEIGDSMGDEYEILQYGALVAFGVGLLILAYPIWRSAILPKQLAVLNVVIAAACFFPTPIPALMLGSRLIWGLSTAVALHRTVPESVAVPVTLASADEPPGGP
jgi:hypothetical protein